MQTSRLSLAVEIKPLRIRPTRLLHKPPLQASIQLLSPKNIRNKLPKCFRASLLGSGDHLLPNSDRKPDEDHEALQDRKAVGNKNQDQ